MTPPFPLFPPVQSITVIGTPLRVSDFGAAKLHIEKYLMTVTGGSRKDDQTHNHAAAIAVKHMVDDCQIMLSELPAKSDYGRGEKKTPRFFGERCV